MRINNEKIIKTGNRTHIGKNGRVVFEGSRKKRVSNNFFKVLSISLLENQEYSISVNPLSGEALFEWVDALGNVVSEQRNVTLNIAGEYTLRATTIDGISSISVQTDGQEGGAIISNLDTSTNTALKSIDAQFSLNTIIFGEWVNRF